MANLTTKWMGLELKNPLIVGACNLVQNTDNLKRMEDAGAAAIVYKSLFEEQIQLEQLEMDEELYEYQDRNAEMISLFPSIEHAGPSEHLMNVHMAKQSVSIPVIASLNCVFSETWVEYAKQLAQTGVDGLELNFYHTPKNPDRLTENVIDHQVEIVKSIIGAVKIPVSVKLSPYYVNVLNVIKQMEGAGAKGFVLFNRFLKPDIDIASETFVNHFSPSTSEENLLPLRYAGLLYGQTQASIGCNSGIHSGKDMAKMLLAGADCTQVVSALYLNKISYITAMLNDLSLWMDVKNYASISDFKGKLSQQSIHDPFVYKRAQYIDIIQQSSEIFKKYPVQ